MKARLVKLLIQVLSTKEKRATVLLPEPVMIKMLYLRLNSLIIIGNNYLRFRFAKKIIKVVPPATKTAPAITLINTTG
jgi:hypothetical protein